MVPAVGPGAAVRTDPADPQLRSTTTWSAPAPDRDAARVLVPRQPAHAQGRCRRRHPRGAPGDRHAEVGRLSDRGARAQRDEPRDDRRAERRLPHRRAGEGVPLQGGCRRQLVLRAERGARKHVAEYSTAAKTTWGQNETRRDKPPKFRSPNSASVPKSRNRSGDRVGRRCSRRAPGERTRSDDLAASQLRVGSRSDAAIFHRPS